MHTSTFVPRFLAAISLVALLVASTHAGDANPGLLVRLYDIEGRMSLVPELRPGQLPNAVKVVATLDLQSKRGDFAPAESGFYTEVVGDLTIAQPGAYAFRLICDDGGMLWIDDRMVINNDGLHGAVPKDGEIELTAGKHKLRVAHFDSGGDKHLELRWRPPAAVAKTPDAVADSDGFTLIPPAALSHGKNVSRETSPGKKQIIPPLRRGLPGDGTPVAGMHQGFESGEGSANFQGWSEFMRPMKELKRNEQAKQVTGDHVIAWLPSNHPGEIKEAMAILSEPSPYDNQRLLLAPPDMEVKRVYMESIIRGENVQWGSLIDILDLQGCAFRFAVAAFDRFEPKGTPTYEMLAVKAMGNGFEIEFTKPLDPRCGWDPESYYVEQWPFETTVPLSNAEARARAQSEPDAQARVSPPTRDGVRYPVTSASVSPDRKRVFLEIPNLKTSHVVYIRLLPPCYSEDGERPWSTEAWYTLNVIPEDRKGEVLDPPGGEPQNVLTAEEEAAGWKLLFDGETTAGWRGYKKDTFPGDGWKVVNTPTDGACIVRVGGGGDICTIDEFDNFELELEWRICAAGNSGVFFRVDESVGWPWESGPEMQVLDNAEHADGRNPKTSAGSNYALYAPTRDATAPVGFFNKARIVANGPHIEHWLNGEKVVEYELGSDEWKALVADSKFKAWPKYGTMPKGHIVLQDHGDRVWYRNIKIRELRD